MYWCSEGEGQSKTKEPENLDQEIPEAGRSRSTTPLKNSNSDDGSAAGKRASVRLAVKTERRMEEGLQPLSVLDQAVLNRDRVVQWMTKGVGSAPVCSKVKEEIDEKVSILVLANSQMLLCHSCLMLVQLVQPLLN